METLEKKCPRCGGSSANSSNPSGRCSKCLKKLASAKKTPGHWQRAQTKADDALRRQKGKNGTAHKKSSGLGTRASIVKQTKSAERKTGEKLSPDRKNNGKGYAASNTRMVPEKLNRGRHKVDPKKLAAWKHRLKKCDIELEDFLTMIFAKAEETNNELLIKSIDGFDTADLEALMDYLIPESEDLEKGAMSRLAPKPQQREHTFWSDSVHPTSDPSTVKRGQVSLVKQHLGNKAAFKNIDGKLHIMLHRGINDYKDPEQSGVGMKLHPEHIEHKGNGLYTDQHNYAKGFAGDSAPHSAWIPLDSIHSNAHHEHGGWEKQEINDPNSRTSEMATNQGISPQQAMEEYSTEYGEGMGRGNHIGVAPGKYPLASKDEVKQYLKLHKKDFKPGKSAVKRLKAK